MAVLRGWNYRKSITLSRADGTVTNYQMKLLVGESSGSTGENVDCGGLCLPTFNDIRFTTSNSTTLLDYWIESITGTTPNQLATIWIEFDSIGISATTFYMYYGNSEASAYSNGNNTFPLLFDNFEWGSNGDSVTTGGWTIGSNTTARISTERAHTGTRSMKVFGVGTALQSDVYKSLTPANGTYSIKFSMYKENATVRAACLLGNGTRGIGIYVNTTEDIYYISSSDVDTGYNMVADSWKIFEINNINFTSGTYDIWYDGVKIKSGAVMYTQNWWNSVLTFENWHSASGNDVYIDNIVVRNWRSTEPTWGSWGLVEEVIYPEWNTTSNTENIFVCTTSGIVIYDLFNTENIVNNIISYNVNSIWANDDYLFIGTENSGVYRVDLTTISGILTEEIFKQYPNITDNRIKYLHGGGNYLCVTTLSGVDRYNLVTDDRVFTTMPLAGKCFQIDTGDYYYETDTSLYANYNDGSSFVYTSHEGNVLQSYAIYDVNNDYTINDMYITKGTSIHNNANTIFLATNHGVIVIEEKRGDEENARKRYYLINS